MRLYDYPLSGNCYNVRLLLHWLNVPFETVPVDCIRMKRRIVEPFSSGEQGATSEASDEAVTCDATAPL